MAPSTFASAAAGSITPTTPSRVDGGGEWARRANGATQTFRRPSVATTLSSSSHQRDASIDAQPARYVPPHRNGSLVETRYSKPQLLHLFRSQQEAEGGLRESLRGLYVAGWEPSQPNGSSGGGWSKRDDNSRDSGHGPDVCWDKDGSVIPVGLVDMSEQEKEMFASSVNSAVKPPANASKDGSGREALPTRRLSISQNQPTPGTFAASSPSAARPGGRRRELSESYPFPSNPLASPPAAKARDEARTSSPPSALRKRATDFKDAHAKHDDAGEKAPEDADATDATRTPFSNIKRHPTAPMSAGVGGPASPWASTPQATGFSPMGTFGNFAVGASAGTPSEKKPGLGAGRAESRFKGLMHKDAGDDAARALNEKSSLNNLVRVNEGSQWRQWNETSAEQDGEASAPSGSAALGGGQDFSPPRTRDMLSSPGRQDSRDDFGFAAFGMTSDANFRGLAQDQHQQGTPQGRGQAPTNEPMSPTSTNPYQSPAQQGAEPDDIDTDGSDIHNAHLPGLGGFMNEGPQPGPGAAFVGFPNLGRIPGAPPSDRSQTSSVGPQRGFSGLNGLGAIPGLGGSSAWGSTRGELGTPVRERAAIPSFGDNAFGAAVDTQSPGLAGLGSSSFFGPAVPGAARGGSRLGPLFAQGAHDQIPGSEQLRTQQDDDTSDTGEGFPRFGMPGNAGFSRDTDSPFRQGFDQGRSDRGMAGEALFGQIGQPAQDPSSGQDGVGQRSQPSMQPPPLGSSASNQPPAAQQKTMVMPDRMRWIYRDPQGNTQGPWSGLEMHDWYKAGFFSPELLVKKYEDADYEPLAQLIRRIGNSREPFLVPQIGIPHGAPSAQSWGTGPVSTSQAQPPFASSFPSFGTTLTADQQNALERRKQEEQYLMARQKEHLAQQQIAQRLQLQGQHNILPQQLHHHSSAQSLHSQPSFGNIASPSYQPSPSQGPTQGQQNVPGFFDNSFRAAGSGGLNAVGAGVDALGDIKEEDVPGLLSRLDLGRQDQGHFGGQGFSQQHDPVQHAQQVNAMLGDRSRLQQEQAQYDAANRYRHEQADSHERLREFQDLQHDEYNTGGAGGVIGKPGGPSFEQLRPVQANIEVLKQETMAAQDRTAHQTARNEPLSLTEQVQQAQSSQQSPQPPSAWGKIDTILPQPFPPAPSQTPLPAPAAQRSRANMAEALHPESRSHSQTSSLDTLSVSIAPWAKEPAEAQKGPSLKEIQELEAKNAARVEAGAAEARRLAFEKELLAQVQITAPAPGLPSSSTWASGAGASPISQAAASTSAWAKTAKAPSTTNAAKSMAQIQKEEEARKRRVAAAAAVALQVQNPALGAAAAQSAGKRYADLASKIAASSSPTAVVPGSSAWTTVGASGKTKTPAPPAAVPGARVASSGSAPAAVAAAAAAVKKPTGPAIRSAPTGAANAGLVNAQDEFKKWAVNELKHDLNKSVSADEFISNLLAFPSEIDIVTEAVHSVSQTIDSRHYAEEFIRRRKLADKGVVEAGGAQKSASPGGLFGAGAEGKGVSGGWSEVAKKGPAKDASANVNKEDGIGAGSFKVVAAKKKGGKR